MLLRREGGLCQGIFQCQASSKPLLSFQYSLVLRASLVGAQIVANGSKQSIASRNESADALSKLEEFRLLEYFLYPQINWNPKSDNIQRIQEGLNVGIDTFLFIYNSVRTLIHRA